MKKVTIKSVICAGIFALALAGSCCANTTLKDIAKPHTGEYECKSVLLGERDLLSSFEYIQLELKNDNTFTLRYKTKLGKTGEEKGTYTYDADKQTLSITQGEKGELKREIPIVKGKIFLSIPIGNRQFSVEFEKK